MAILKISPEILLKAFVLGIIPSLFWLWFWLKEEERPEPNTILMAVFFLGMLAVVAVIPIQRFIQEQISIHQIQLVLWAAAEEILKYIAVLVVVYRTDDVNSPIDWPIYMVTAALGFAALENTLFLIKPFSVGDTSGLLTAASLGQLRFLGSTLLHAVSSSIVGIMIGLSFFMREWAREWFLFFGFVFAIALHSAFNLFIINGDGNNFLKVCAYLWVVAVVVMLLFEKVRRMSEN